MLLDNPNPYVFHVGDFGIRWYGLLLAVSIAFGVWYIIVHTRERGWDEDMVLSLIIWALLSGMAGARLIYILTNWSYYTRLPAEIIRIDHGGLSWHGALLGGVLAGWLYLKRENLSLQVVLDAAVPALTLGYTLVRLANILNQEVLGRPAAILGGRHPAQIYGSLIGLVLLIRYYLMRKRAVPDGYHFWSFFLWYSLLRGAIEETFRANPLYAWGYINETWGMGFFTLTQLVTPALLLLSGYFLWRIGRCPPSAE